MHLLAFFIAFGIFIGLWAIDTYATGNVQSSYYYKNKFDISTSLDIASVISTYTSSSLSIFDGKTNGYNSTIAVAMSLVFSWLFWKITLIVYTYHVISR